MNAAHPSLNIIRAEHEALAAMLRSLLLMVRQGPGDKPERFFSVVRAMLLYITEFPEKLHHPKESELLFPILARQQVSLRSTIERLERDHARGETSVHELLHMLTAWEFIGSTRREAFEQALSRYVGFYLDHMKLEETVVLPEALKVLDEQAWERLDSAFEANRDPLTSEGEPGTEYARLFTLITNRAPAPIGVGDA